MANCRRVSTVAFRWGNAWIAFCSECNDLPERTINQAALDKVIAAQESMLVMRTGK